MPSNYGSGSWEIKGIEQSYYYEGYEKSEEE